VKSCSTIATYFRTAARTIVSRPRPLSPAPPSVCCFLLLFLSLLPVSVSQLLSLLVQETTLEMRSERELLLGLIAGVAALVVARRALAVEAMVRHRH
jgi:hypothetical protein